MMLGGGFLDQMNKTLKYNRDILKKKKHKPFDKDLYTGKELSSEILVDRAPMAESERRMFIAQLKAGARKRMLIRLFILLIFTVAGAGVLLKLIG